MGASAFHHVALRVADIERAGRFYVDVFDGRWQTRPGLREGPFAEIVMGGTPGARFKVCHIGFATGTIELFEFLEPVEPTGPIPPARGTLIHFAIQVDDVPATLARVEAAGGRRYWPEVTRIGRGVHAIYVTDLDGNVVELIDASVDEVVDLLIAQDPGLAPGE